MSRSQLIHPYVVVRFMAAVYGRRRVWFGVGVTAPLHDLVVPIPAPHGEHLSPEQRQAVIEAALAATVITGFRRCVVFAPGDVAYVEPDGRVVTSEDAPSGGFVFVE